MSKDEKSDSKGSAGEDGGSWGNDKEKNDADYEKNMKESGIDEEDQADLKIILLGDSAVGKSKLVERFMMDQYVPRQVGHVFFWKSEKAIATMSFEQLAVNCLQMVKIVFLPWHCVFLFPKTPFKLSTYALTMFRKEWEHDETGKKYKIGKQLVTLVISASTKSGLLCA